jgi:hypothetical protein
MYYEQRTDAQVGVALLVVGFALQAASALGWDKTIDLYALWSAIGLLALVLLAYVAGRTFAIKRGVLAALKFAAQKGIIPNLDADSVYAQTVKRMVRP